MMNQHSTDNCFSIQFHIGMIFHLMYAASNKNSQKLIFIYSILDGASRFASVARLLDAKISRSMPKDVLFLEFS